MIRVLIIFLYIIALGQFAQAAATIQGDGRFYSHEEDGINFVKKQLMANAIRDIISKELKKMNLNHESFWQNFDAQFEEHFTPIKEALHKKYKHNEPNQTANQKKQLKKVLRRRKLLEKLKFGNLRKIILSYKIKKMSRSPQYPQARFMTMEATVNRKRLYDIYSQFENSSAKRQFNKLFLSIYYDVPQSDWSLLGVDSRSDLTDVLEKEWMSWIENKSRLNFETISYASGIEREDLEGHLKLSSDALENLSFVKSGEGEKANPGRPTSGGYTDSLWLKIKIKVDVLQRDELFNSRKFNLSGELIVYDLKNNNPVLFYDFPKTEVTFQGKKKSEMASQLASRIYQLPIGKLTSLKMTLDRIPTNYDARKVHIHNVSSILEVFSLNKLISSKGVTVRARPSSESLTQGKAVVNLEFQGAEESLKGLLFGLANAKLENGKRITFPYEDNPFYILLSGNEARTGGQ